MFTVNGKTGSVADVAPDFKEWENLYNNMLIAQNFYGRNNERVIGHHEVKITVAKVLGIVRGINATDSPEVAIVEDTEGRVWNLEETEGDNGSHEVHPGMSFLIRVEEVVQHRHRSIVFPL